MSEMSCPDMSGYWTMTTNENFDAYMDALGEHQCVVCVLRVCAACVCVCERCVCGSASLKCHYRSVCILQTRHILCERADSC